MNTVFGTYENGRVKLDAPVDWSDGSRVVVQPTAADDEQVGMREEDWPTDAQGIAEWRAKFAELEPLEFTPEEEAVDIHTRHLRFDIGLLAERLVDATNWIKRQSETTNLGIGYFGSSTGGGAALMAAAELGEEIGAVVSRGGRPDLAGAALPQVTASTLLIVGGFDYAVIEMNKEAYAQLRCEKELKIVPGATHLFEEPGALEEVAHLAAEWFQRYLHSDVPARKSAAMSS